MRELIASLVVVTLMSVACGHADTPTEPLRELAKARSGALDVVLLSAGTALSTGKDTATVEFRSISDGGLVDVGTVKANAMMAMAGMSPMFGPVDVQPTGVPGRYIAATELSMAGGWRLSFEWNGPAGQGSATFSPMVN